MKKFFIVLFFAFFSHAEADTLPKSAIPAKLAANNLLTDITFTGERYVAVGKWGNIVYSNTEEQWLQASSPVQSLLTAVFFINEQQGWAVGHDSTIINTQDGGLTWQIQQYLPELDKPLLDIIFFDTKHGLAIGAYGQSFRTTDGGVTWKKEFYDSLLYPEDKDYLDELKENDPEGYEIETASILPHFNRIHQDKDTLWLVGELGLMATSNDQGKTWQRLEEIYPGSFFSFAQLNGVYIVAGLRGTTFVSPDGESWQQLTTDTTASINDIRILNDRAILLANGGVWLTYKAGKLTKQMTENGKSLLAGASNGNKLVVASEAGIQEISVQ